MKTTIGIYVYINKGSHQSSWNNSTKHVHLRYGRRNASPTVSC